MNDSVWAGCTYCEDDVEVTYVPYTKPSCTRCEGPLDFMCKKCMEFVSYETKGLVWRITEYGEAIHFTCDKSLYNFIYLDKWLKKIDI